MVVASVNEQEPFCAMGNHNAATVSFAVNPTLHGVGLLIVYLICFWPHHLACSDVACDCAWEHLATPLNTTTETHTVSSEVWLTQNIMRFQTSLGIKRDLDSPLLRHSLSSRSNRTGHLLANHAQYQWHTPEYINVLF